MIPENIGYIVEWNPQVCTCPIRFLSADIAHKYSSVCSTWLAQLLQFETKQHTWIELFSIPLGIAGWRPIFCASDVSLFDCPPSGLQIHGECWAISIKLHWHICKEVEAIVFSLSIGECLLLYSHRTALLSSTASGCSSRRNSGQIKGISTMSCSKASKPNTLCVDMSMMNVEHVLRVYYRH